MTNQPSQAVLYILLGLIIGVPIGYFYQSSSKIDNKKYSKVEKIDSDEEEEIDFSYSGEPSKLVLVVRTDLGMTKGKVAAQCSHATLACYKKSVKRSDKNLKVWEYEGQPKITLKCDGEEEMLALYSKAEELGLVSCYIRDAGRTQIAAGSMTVLGIGPGPISKINQVTGHLKLY